MGRFLLHCCVDTKSGVTISTQTHTDTHRHTHEKKQCFFVHSGDKQTYLYPGSLSPLSSISGLRKLSAAEQTRSVEPLQQREGNHQQKNENRRSVSCLNKQRTGRGHGTRCVHVLLSVYMPVTWWWGYVISVVQVQPHASHSSTQVCESCGNTRSVSDTDVSNTLKQAEVEQRSRLVL